MQCYGAGTVHFPGKRNRACRYKKKIFPLRHTLYMRVESQRENFKIPTLGASGVTDKTDVWGGGIGSR